MTPVRTEENTRETDVSYSPTGVPFPPSGDSPRSGRSNRRQSPQPDTEPQPPGEDEDEAEDQEAMSITEFIETYKEAIARTVTQAYAPTYQPSLPEHNRPLPRLLRKPIGAQLHGVRAVSLSLRANRGTVVVGEMGTGKTYIGGAAAHMAQFKNVLVICPPHLVRKWKRELEMTIPGVQAAIVRTLTELTRLEQEERQPRMRISEAPRFTIMSREVAKRSYWWEPAYVTRPAIGGNWTVTLRCPDCGQEARREDGSLANGKQIEEEKLQCSCGGDLQQHERRVGQRKGDVRVFCPGCFERVRDKDNIPMTVRQLEKKRTLCPRCGGPLWQPTILEHRKRCPCRDCTGQPGRMPHYKNHRYALADYIKKRMKGFFDLLICDEVHEYKGRGTAQGIAAGNLAETCGTVLTLTGTLTGGYSSTLFHLLYRFTPEIRGEFQHNDQSRWIDRYGFRQKKYSRRGGGDDDAYEDGRSSRRRGYKPREKETPGIAPAALFHIIGNTVFLRLNDVTDELPPYDEQVMVQEMDDRVDRETKLSQESAYQMLEGELWQAMLEALQQGSPRLMGAYLQSLMSFPDGCTLGEEVVDPEDGSTIARIPPLPGDVTYPKEQALIDLVKEEKQAGRRVLVYATHTDTRDITPRLEEFLSREGVRTAVLKSDTVNPEAREDWVNRKVAEGIEVLICNPRLVQTGLDLVDFPTICWQETDYSIYTMRQASRRSWRIGQKQPVKVVFMVYDGTIQTEALRLVAKKMQSSLAVEGELPEEGLTTFGDDGQDIIMTLAKQIINGDSFRAGGSLENIFARAREVEREAERYLVDDTWEAPPEEPEQPEEEPDAQPERPAPEPNPTALSWTEFLAEPEQPTRRKRRKPEPPSLFQWAVEQEAKRR